MPQTTSTQKARYRAPMIDHLLDTVEFLARHNRPFGVTELSRELGISTNAIFRLMHRLVDRGYAQIDPDSRGYQLGSKFFTLGMQLSERFDLRHSIRPALEELCRTVGETCQAHIPDGRQMLVVDVVTPQSDFFIQVTTGSRLYYHANAFGKAVLALLDPADVEQRLPADLPKLTEHTITDRDTLIDSLQAIGQTGLAYDWGEYTQGVYCIGAPVLDVNGHPVAGVGMTGLSVRFREQDRRGQELAVLRTADAIAARIGYEGPRYRDWLNSTSMEDRP